MAMQADFHDSVEHVRASELGVAGNPSQQRMQFEQAEVNVRPRKPAIARMGKPELLLANKLEARFKKQFDTDATAIMLVGSDDSIKFANDAARRAYDVEAGDAIETLPFEAESCESLSSAIRCCASGLRENIVQIDRMNCSGALLAILSPIRIPNQNNLLVQLRCSDFVWPRRLDNILSSSYDLTRAEMEITAFVVEGFSVARIAEARGSSISTVRCQLRTIYEKLSVNSQVELMRVVMGIVIAFATIAPAMIYQD